MIQEKLNLRYVFFLAIVAAIGGFLFGYDTAVISGTTSQVKQIFNLDSISEGWYVGCALVGSIFGVSIGGLLSDNLGRKNSLIISAILFCASAIWCSVAGSFDILIIARILGGVGIGIVSIVSPLYISEISIPQYRGRMVALYQLAVTVGFLGAYLMNFALLNYSKGGAADLTNPLLYQVFHTEVWRSMLGMSVLPALLFFTILFFIPESPRWLMVKQRYDAASFTLEHIFGSKSLAEKEKGAIKKSLGENNKIEWRELLKPGILKAVLIGAAIAILGQFMGVNAVLYYGPSIFESSGLSGDDSLFYQVIVGLVNVVTTIIAIFIIDKVGRKKLVYFGVTGMIVSLVLIALFFMYGSGMSSIILLICFLAYVFFCAISISAVIWVLLSEMFPNKIRGLAMSIAGFALWVGTYLIGQLTPWMLENLSPAGTFILFAFMSLPYMYIVWKHVPDTTGKSLEDIEEHWKNK